MSMVVENIRVYGDRRDILIKDGTIQQIGTVSPEDKDNAQTVLDGTKRFAIPSLINAHTHTAMTLFRGFGDDMPLQQWLEEKIWPREAELDHEMVYWGSRLAILEMIQTGTTFFNDMYWEFDAICEAVRDSGIRAMVSGVFIDQFDPEMAKKQRNQNKRLFERTSRLPDRVQFALGPHSIYTVSPESLRWVGEFSQKHNLPVHIHLCETKEEVENCREQQGMTPVEYLDELDVLHDNLIAAHAIWLTDHDIEILAERGVSIIYNPISNLKLTSGDDFAYSKLKNAGIPICLGTDGVASNNSYNLWEEIKMASLIQKNRQDDATALPAHEAFNLATSSAARIFDLNCGRIEETARADFLMVREDHPSLAMSDIHDEFSHLAYTLSPDAIETVICDGEILMNNDEIEDKQEILDKARQYARKLCYD